MVGCGGFKAIFCFFLSHHAQTRFCWKRAWTDTFFCPFLFFGNKSSKNQSLVRLKKLQNFFKKKKLGRKGDEGKSLQVARVLFKGSVLDALGKSILLIKK